MSQRKRVFGIGLAVFVVGVTLAGCEEKPQPTPSVEPPSIEATTPIQPDKRLEVVDLDAINALIAETAQRDQVLVIDFWATWCVPCIEMFPELHQGLKARGEGVRVVSVTLDDPSREADAIAFLAQHGGLHDAYIVKDDSAAQQALADGMGEDWNDLAVPAILVYDSGGDLTAEFFEGGSVQEMLDHVDDLLASGQEPKL